MTPGVRVHWPKRCCFSDGWCCCVGIIIGETSPCVRRSVIGAMWTLVTIDSRQRGLLDKYKLKVASKLLNHFVFLLPFVVLLFLTITSKFVFEKNMFLLYLEVDLLFHSAAFVYRPFFARGYWQKLKYSPQSCRSPGVRSRSSSQFVGQMESRRLLFVYCV